MNGHNGASSGKDGRLGGRAAKSPGARCEDAFDDVVARKDPEGLRKGLTTRHIQMIAFGGAIGTGLFYGSAEGIKLAGPSLLLAYALGGIVIFFVVRAMGEMSVHRPSSGSFSRYANDYWSPRAGFVAGWNYWFNYVAVAMAELTVVGQYIQYWFPSVPAWASAAAVLLVITAVNLVGVKAFGEFEFWFAAIKVAAVVGMIALGLYVIAAGVNSNPRLPDPSLSHLFDRGGFFPGGLDGFLVSLVFVMFSFGGIELIGITAGEAENPQRSIPKAVNQVVYRILIFYIGALFVIMAVVPWDAIDGKLSPFVQIFDSVGISVAAHVLNFVVLTAALSVYNSGLYSNGRVLYSLARQGNAPKAFMRLSRRGTPYAGVLFSSMVTAVAVAVIYFLPETAFSILMAMALGASIISWVMILLTHRAFRKRIGSGAAGLAFKLPGGLASNGVALVCLVGVFILMAFNPDYRTSVAVMPIWLFILFAAYEAKKKSSKPGRPSNRMQEARR
mgnify:FL=1